MKAFCEDCQRVVDISPTGQKQNPSRGSSTWWLIDVHADKGEICNGSGKRV